MDALFDATGGQTRDAALMAVRDDGRAVFILDPPEMLERGITGESFYGDVNRLRLEALNRLVDAGRLHAGLEATLKSERKRARRRVASDEPRVDILAGHVIASRRCRRAP